jgi:hypothetical protein
MNLETENNGRNIWKRIWYPKQEDVIGFRVFQMISIPVIMVLSIVVNIYTRSATWNFLMMAWLLVAILLWVVASIRFKKINPIKDE